MIHESDMPESQISRIFAATGQTVIVLRDGTTLELSDLDVEMLEMSFASECENCGFDPNEDPFEDSADEEEDDDEYPQGG